MLLGCIADDLTGATDLALTLTQEGMRTVQCTGVPERDLDVSGADALVVALKSRSIAASEAVQLSVDAARRLRELGAKRLLFKYCSTFDSTDAGNIGPVADALLDETGGGLAIACPAFPRAGRTVYAGQLFVNGVPLAESPMKDHPLNPMHDSDLRRVLARQSRHAVGHVGFADVDGGAGAIAAALRREEARGQALCIVDAVTDRHLRDIGMAVAHRQLVTGGSGIAMGLPAAYLAAGLLDQLRTPPHRMSAPTGRAIILSGSCSAATRAQVAAAQAAGIPNLQLAPEDVAAGRQTPATALDWLARHDGDGPLLIYSSADPDTVREAQAVLGREAAGRLIEDCLAEIARGAANLGFRRFLVAGGETSGAVVAALGPRALSIGPEIDPGVPWTRSIGRPDLALALKSGNFGTADFFLKAWRLLD